MAAQKLILYPKLHAPSLPAANQGIINMDPSAACIGGGSTKWGVHHTSALFCTDCSAAAQRLLSGGDCLLLVGSGGGPAGGFLFPALYLKVSLKTSLAKPYLCRSYTLKVCLPPSDIFLQ